MTQIDLTTNADNAQHYPIWSSGAIFDITRAYRYSLWRTWSIDHPRIVFIMLNPNTAGATYSDPTIRRCIQFARNWNYGSVEVVNLFAWCAPDPRALLHVADPIGPDNNHYLTQAISRAHNIVAAWGIYGSLLSRDHAVLDLLAAREQTYCLGLTKDGHPRHPLHVKGNVSLTAL